MYSLRTSLVVALLCFLSHVDAFWRMNCAIIQRGRIDPLVSFGAIAGHTHTIIGGSNIGISATADSLTNSACTSCEIQADKSAYWTPTLFYQFKNGSFSQGDTTGYGFHGDFANGWDLPVLQQAVDECLSVSNFGTIEECAILKASQTSGASSNCPERRPQIEETVTGLLPKLPGCITVTEGPERAPGSAMNCGPDVIKPNVASTVDSMPQKTNAPKAVGDAFGISLQQKYVGCFNDSGAGTRALNAASVDSTSMTVDYCQQWCQDRGYRLSGVEYSQECKCDNALNPTIVANEAQCTWLCAGTMAKGGDQQICGGYGYISIYNNTDPSFNANGDMRNSAGGASAPKGLKPFPPNYVGCATDGQKNVRILTSKSTSQVSMSAASCRTFCAQGDGHQFYGTEYGSECFCGNFLQTPNFITNLTSTPTHSTCSMRCTGAGDEICGGPNALSLYKEPNFVAPTIKSPVGKYVSQDCITDSAANRTLKGASTTSNNMTVEMCSTFCAAKKMKYFGVEYGKECFCDNSIRIQDLKAQTCKPKNMMLCAGDRKQYCGGSGFMNLYFAR